jgi:tRNA(fMet)-specific endonuclease VapC
MIYMLDTDTCSYIMRDRAEPILKKLHEKSSSGDVICMSVITYQELRYGAERVDTNKYHERIDAICERIDYVADWGTEQADMFATTQVTLFKAGSPIGFADTMIAAHAITLPAVLVTNNIKHFSKVDGLMVENWLIS